MWVLSTTSAGDEQPGGRRRERIGLSGESRDHHRIDAEHIIKRTDDTTPERVSEMLNNENAMPTILRAAQSLQYKRA